MPSVLGMEATKHKKWKNDSKERRRRYLPSVGDDLEVVEGDKVAQTEPDESRRRRTVLLQRVNESWGFTLQSYGIHHKSTDDIELLTYIDYVEYGSPAYLAGLRPGDVILSINGTSMEDADHSALVAYIKNCQQTMRMVVLFEDCCKKVEMHMRYLRLKRVLAEKVFEMRSLEMQERRVLAGLSRFDSCRSSIASSSSSICSAWDDRLSLRPEMEVFTPASAAYWQNISDESSTDTASLASRSSPYLGPRFDFDRASLPVNARLKPQLTQSYSFGTTQEFVRNKRHMSTRSMLVESPSWKDFSRPIPEEATSSPIRRQSSIPDNLGPQPDNCMEMDLYRMSIGNNMRQRHRSRHLSGNSLNSTRPESPNNSLIDSNNEVSVDVHNISEIPETSGEDGLLSEAAALPSHNPSFKSTNHKSPKSPRRRSPRSPRHKSANHKSPSRSPNQSPVHTRNDSSARNTTSSGYSTETISTGNQDMDDVACWLPRKVGSSIFYIEEPDIESPDIGAKLSVEASPSSPADSIGSKFSYSDLPQIALKFLRDDDEITHL